MAYSISLDNIVSFIYDGRLTPTGPWASLSVPDAASRYLDACREAGICVGCNNPLLDDDRDFSGPDTNACIVCACS